MSNRSWLQPHLNEVLKKNTSVLDSWRCQRSTKAGRPKNFENWLLVELVHHLLKKGIVRELRTNGHFSETKVKARGVKKLSGPKAKAEHLSPDLSVRLRQKNRIVSIELKTGLAPKEILNDLRIVRHYNRIGISDWAEFGWVVLLPEKKDAMLSSQRTFKKISDKIQKEKPRFLLSKEYIKPWLISCVVVPID